MLSVNFEPNKIYMNPESGRVYHPAIAKYGSIGLIRSKLAIQFSKHFLFETENCGPNEFTWNGVSYKLDKTWTDNLNKVK